VTALAPGKVRKTHTPARQNWELPQTWPQLPQFWGSVSGSTSHPLATSWSQFRKGEVHSRQIPPLQNRVLSQTLPQLPQFCMSVSDVGANFGRGSRGPRIKRRDRHRRSATAPALARTLWGWDDLYSGLGVPGTCPVSRADVAAKVEASGVVQNTDSWCWSRLHRRVVQSEPSGGSLPLAARDRIARMAFFWGQRGKTFGATAPEVWRWVVSQSSSVVQSATQNPSSYRGHRQPPREITLPSTRSRWQLFLGCCSSLPLSAISVRSKDTVAPAPSGEIDSLPTRTWRR
jgi:hypothetical protein